jgi:allophanate hydrolase
VGGAFERAAGDLAAAGVELVPVDLRPFLEAARLLYDGALVAERHAAVGEFVDARVSDPSAGVDPTVERIISRAGSLRASDLVRDLERLDRLRLAALSALGDADVLLVPTVPEHPTIAEAAADPVAVNSRLGTYTNFMNLLDLCGVAVPAGGRASSGVTVVARAFHDRVAADVARLLVSGPAAPDVAGPPGVPLVVVGAHLSGLPLNGQLTSAGARLLRAVRTAPE